MHADNVVFPFGPLLGRVALAGLLGGCTQTSEPSPPDLQVSAEAMLFEAAGEPAIRTRVTIDNPMEEDVEIMRPSGCAPFVLVLHETSDRDGPPAWAPFDVCDAACNTTVPIPARDALHMEDTVAVAAVLGDSLPAGRYYASASLNICDPMEMAGPVPAGELQLDRSDS